MAFFVVQAVCFAWEIYYKRIALGTMQWLHTHDISFGKYLGSISATVSASPVFRVGEFCGLIFLVIEPRKYYVSKELWCSALLIY